MNENITGTMVLTPNRCLWREELEGGLIYSTLTHEFYHIDNIGYSIWILCDGKRMIRDIVSGLANKHTISYDQCYADVTEYLLILLLKKFLIKI